MAPPGPTNDEAQSKRPLRTRLMVPVVAGILIVASLAALVHFAAPEATVKVVVMMPGEADFSHLDETVAAVEVAAEELNKWGGIGGRKTVIVSAAPVLGVDDPVEMFREMERVHRPLFFVVGSCALLVAVSPAAEELGIPVIGISAAPGLTDGKEWVFRYYTSTEMEATSALEILAALEVTSLGMIHSNDPHGCSVNEMLSDGFQGMGGVTESAQWTSDETSQAAIVADLSDNEAIYVVGPCAVAAGMLAAVKASGYAGHVISSSCLSTPNTWGMEELEGVYVSSPLLYKPENILALAVAQKFEQQYGLQLTHHSAAGYDIVMLVHGLLEGSEVSRESLKSQLESGFVFTGVLGSFTVPEGSHDFVFPLYPSYVSGGELWYL